MNNTALTIALALESSARLVESGHKAAELHFVEAETLWAAAESLGVDEAVGSYLFGWQMELHQQELQQEQQDACQPTFTVLN
ncbi:MAG: hypothetical protein EBT03_12940 [Betaproteobacteria bacterium]|nr:hypothetical protein [Betaproteobacteria bacterium]